jgi:serralysin
LLAATGDNYLDGGDGQDTASYANGGAVTVSLALGDWQDTGGSGWDYLVSIENLTGSSSGDTLTGDAGGNVLDGSGGNDTLNGGGGNDTLDGGAGDNTMAGGDGADVYAVRSSGDVVTEINTSTDIGESDLVMSYLTSHTLGANIERGMVSTTGSSVLVGNELDNILYSGTGHTALMGGIGEDTASYANGAAVTVSLALDNYQATGGSGSDALYEIENLDGSAYADMLTGDAGSNVLSGGDGADTLDGGAGDDVLTGGAGDDIFSFGSIADTSFEDVLDRISDFATGDKIDLSLIDADSDTGGNDAFTSFVGEGDAFTAAGQLRLVDGVLYGNTDGDEDAEFAITLTGVTTIEIGDIIG